MAKTYDFDAYLAQARPTAFVLRVSPDQTITIEPPDTETLLRIDEARTARRVLELLCGEHYSTVYNLIRDKHAGVLTGLVEDMRRHFNLGEFQGGTPASST
jgi:hypothetical protein